MNKYIELSQALKVFNNCRKYSNDKKRIIEVCEREMIYGKYLNS